ncbi:hypothetical protein F0562_015825 [Nyssa sinensis]|uniref:non-specific serine/threonine protein kinase n=1 Tax=Nyssa sinensis TaxID=561372 RepID=A0A5J4ZL87_9ASTE|nr:hypothetical protein F0562_015825 [Nyssa sinensis]
MLAFSRSLKQNIKIVAIKQLDRDGLQGNREFLVEVLMLSLLHHPNLVNLIGYYADGDQRLLVYEYMPLGSLEDHFHDISPGKKQLDWNTRMKIAAGAAKGLEYLHDKTSPSVIYRDLKCSNILLNEGYHPKLSDFVLAKLGPVGDNTHVSTRVMVGVSKAEQLSYTAAYLLQGTKIQAVMFNKAVRKFEGIFQHSKAYLISNSTVKKPNEKFANVHLSLELVLQPHTDVRETKSTFDAHIFANEFVKFKKVQKHIEINSYVDIFGFVSNVGQTYIIKKKTGGETHKREIIVMNKE